MPKRSPSASVYVPYGRCQYSVADSIGVDCGVLPQCGRYATGNDKQQRHKYRFTHIVNPTQFAESPPGLASALLRVAPGDQAGFMLVRHILITSRRAA